MTENSPYADSLAIRRETDAEGRAVAAMTPGDTAFGREGVMHGGAIAALLHNAGRFAVRQALESGDRADVPLHVVSMTIDYLRPGLMVPGIACGEIVKLGARVANVQVRAWGNDKARPFALAKLTIGIGDQG